MKDASAAQLVGEPKVHRVVITGLGALTAHGHGWPLVRRALAAGETALAQVAVPGRPGSMAALVSELAPFRQAFPMVRPPLPVRQTRMVLLAALDALTDAGWETGSVNAYAGVMLDRGAAAAAVVAQFMEPVLRHGPRKSSPLLFAQSVANAPLGAVAIHFGLRGPSLLTMGGGAMYLALETLQRGEATAILCGGFDEIEGNMLASFADQGIFRASLSPTAMRPYDPGSEGTIPGEGSVCLLLENAEHAIGRGARIHAELRSVAYSLGDFAGPAEDAELLGWGRPDGATFAEVATQALHSARVAPPEVDLVVGGGNGTLAIDQAELAGWRRLGLSHLSPHSLKGCVGEGLGMAAAASVAWAADRVARGAASVALITNLEFHAQYFAAVATRWVA